VCYNEYKRVFKRAKKLFYILRKMDIGQKKPLIIAGLILLALILIFAGIALYLYLAPKPSPTPTPTQAPILSPEEQQQLEELDRLRSQSSPRSSSEEQSAQSLKELDKLRQEVQASSPSPSISAEEQLRKDLEELNRLRSQVK